MELTGSQESADPAGRRWLGFAARAVTAHGGPGGISLARLRIFSIVLPILFMAGVQACAMLVLERQFGDANGHWVAVGILAGGVILFTITVFRILSGMHQRIVRQNDELAALNAVARAVSGSLDLREAVTRALDNVVEVTRSAAGEIVVDDGTDEDVLRIDRGDPEWLAELDALKSRIERDGRGEGGRNGVRIVEVETVESPAVSEAHRRTYACVPLSAQDRQLGVMRLVADEAGQLCSEGSDKLLASMGSQIAVAIQASHLFHDVVGRGKEAQALYEIGLDITSLQDVRSILRSIVTHAREIVGSEAAALCLACPEGGLTLAGYSGPKEATGSVQTRVPVFTDALGTMSDEMVRHAATGPCDALGGHDGSGHLAAPLVVGSNTIGELCVSGIPACSRNGRRRELLSALADMAAIAINNARLVERERYVAVLEERENISREMHDSLAQVLGYLHLRAQIVKRDLLHSDIEKASVELDDMASLAHEAYIDVREAILGLRETVSPDMGIAGALKEYLHKFSRQSAISAELAVEGEAAPQLSPEVEVQVIRVVQEALTNVRKHASASRAVVRIRHDGDEVAFSVEDDGRGFDMASRGSIDVDRFGMRSMRERVEKAGGRFEVESAVGRGTTVRMTFPLVQGDEDGFRAGD